MDMQPKAQKRHLEFAFKKLNLEKTTSVFTEKNTKSQHIMKKIEEFNHPKLKEYPKFEKCICYEIHKNA